MNSSYPSEQHQLLARLAGQWDGDETMYPPDSEKPVQVKSVIQSRMELGDYFLFMGYAQLQDGQPTYAAHGVMGMDHSGETVTMYWFDSQGWNPQKPFCGQWEGDLLQLNVESDNGHDRLTYELTSPDEYVTRVENSADGKTWTTLIEGTYRRVKQAE